MPLSYANALIRKVLSQTRTIAMVGASGNWKRPSFFAMKYLQKKGYRVIPINPGRAGDEILGETVYASLNDVAAPIDMVDVFRNSNDAAQVIDDVITLKDEKQIATIWLQLGVRNDAAARRAEDTGLTVIMDRCPKIEYGRLSGEIAWCGVNTGLVTSKPLKSLHS
jgi:predicted CoA-binding protein|tara:strand:- start:408 stop:905 length:498 start_codon:yes stop_codon:yes gene_type:complete